MIPQIIHIGKVTRRPNPRVKIETRILMMIMMIPPLTDEQRRPNGPKKRVRRIDARILFLPAFTIITLGDFADVSID